MKNIFGVCKDNEEFDGKGFVVRTVNPILEEEINSHLETNETLEKKASLPKALKIIKLIAFYGALIIVVGILRSLGDVSLKEAYGNAPFLFYIGGVLILTFAVLKIYEANKHEDVAQSEEVKHLETESTELLKNALLDLKVPEESILVDVFSYGYKVKNGKEKQLTSFFQYINTEMHLFKEEDNLCLANAHEVYSIPISYIKSIKMINKKATVFGWNKELAYNSPEYKKYKIAVNNYGTLFIKPYYSILINNGFEDFELLVPSYDIDKFLNLTNLEIEKEEVTQ